MGKKGSEPQAISEELLDKMVDALEGPINTMAERLMSSKLVLAPLGLTLNVVLRVARRLKRVVARVSTGGVR